MVVLGHSWLFLQPNNSQFSNCQIRNTRTSTACVIPTLGIPAKRQAGPSNPTLSPVPPVLSGPDQVRFSPQLSWLFLLFFAARYQPMLGLLRSHAAPPLGVSWSQMKR
jgi:hypothetical protein